MTEIPKEILEIMQAPDLKYIPDNLKARTIKILRGMMVSIPSRVPDIGNTTREIPKPIPISSAAEMLLMEILATLAHPEQEPTPFIAMLRDKKLWLTASKSLETELAETQVALRSEITAWGEVSK